MSYRTLDTQARLILGEEFVAEMIGKFGGNGKRITKVERKRLNNFTHYLKGFTNGRVSRREAHRRLVHYFYRQND